MPVHELGHAIAGWFYGYPSIPAFDFQYGGGYTSHDERVPMIQYAVPLILCAAIYLTRARKGAAFSLGALLAFCLFTSFSERHEVVILYMGHGTELVFCGIFFYRGFTGSAVKLSAERPLYAFLAWLMWFENLRFAWKLMVDPVERVMYEDAKGGGHWMDFSQIAEAWLQVRLESVAGVHAFLTVATLAISVMLALTQETWAPWFFASDESDS